MGAATTARQPLLGLAAGQHGLFSSAQAHAAGMSDGALKAWARSGAVTRWGHGVWSVAGVPDTEERLAMGAVLSHRRPVALAGSSAGWVWELPGHWPCPVAVLSIRDRHHPSGCHTRTSTVLEPCDVTIRRGLPVLTPTRTIFDLAGRQRPERTKLDLNNLMSRGLVTLDLLKGHLDRLAERGRPGITVMRERITALEMGEEPTESGLELRCRDILHEAGFAALEQQVELGDHVGVIARVDFLDRTRRIVFEVDSDRFHRGLVDRQLDAAKTARLEAAGWTVVRITEHEIFWDRPALTTRLRRLRARTPLRDA